MANEEFSRPTAGRILTIGLHPKSLDYSRFPDLDEQKLLARIETGHAAMRAAGFDAVSCLVGTDPETAEREVRARLDEGPVAVAMIGGAIRLMPEHTELFERIVEALRGSGAVLCFNTSPETTVDALRRAARLLDA
ncbi:hypothetical protein DFR70_102967 [Nocardia tenerifensis]|uniref:Uncharacterized protein n=1 Tax=Nocardia tenerifensis TaxID=228006 RepID=A0A318K7F9_9NOCA|nr:hypothetical protein [Nocardia tenerifensis]PXX69278.1 hypothetical protein DFR70_102967 [Nocardia tenerifensis]